MRFTLPLTIALGLASATPALALPRVQSSQKVSTLQLQKFEISNIFVHAFNDPATTYNRAISFHFLDQNSQTSSICTASWTQTNSTNTHPSSFTQCDYSGEDETFQWYFNSFSNIQEFSIEFNHEWNDPKNFPPPYTLVGMFSTQNTFNLTCIEGNGAQGCYLPGNAAGAPYLASINGLTN